jgi:hypothetical protein
MRFVTENVKGYNAYSVVNDKGEIVASSHIVQVKNDRYTILIGGKWAGIKSQADAIAKLKSLVPA